MFGRPSEFQRKEQTIDQPYVHDVGSSGRAANCDDGQLALANNIQNAT